MQKSGQGSRLLMALVGVVALAGCANLATLPTSAVTTTPRAEATPAAAPAPALPEGRCHSDEDCGPDEVCTFLDIIDCCPAHAPCVAGEPRCVGDCEGLGGGTAGEGK